MNKKQLLPYMLFLTLVSTILLTPTLADIIITDSEITYNTSPLTQIKYNETTGYLDFNGTMNFEQIHHYGETASYVIFGEDTNDDGVYDIIYAKNGTTGKIDFSGTNASWVIQNAIDAFPSTGGKIYIKEGEYIIDSSIEVKSYLTILGEGFNTVLKANENLNSDIISYTGTSDIIEFYLADLVIDGEKSGNTAGNGVYIEKPSRVILHNIKIFDAAEIGIYLCQTPSAAHGVHIFSCYVYNCGLDNIRIESVNDGHILDTVSGWAGRHCLILSSCNQWIITNSHFGGGGTGYTVAISGGKWNSIIGCIIESSNHSGLYLSGTIENRIIGNNFWNHQEDAIYLYNSDFNCIKANTIKYNYLNGINLAGGSDENIVSSNIISESSLSLNGGYNDIRVTDGSHNQILSNVLKAGLQSNKPARAIYISSSANSTVVKFNDLRDDGFTVSPLTNSGTNSIIEENYGFTTENSGSATISNGGTSVTVNHGLAGTPNIILLTPAGNYTVWYDSVDSSSFTIHCYPTPSSDLTISWEAIYKP